MKKNLNVVNIRHRLAIMPLFIVLILLGPYAMAQHIIDFESLPEGTVVFNQYQNKGVLFPTKPIIIKPEAGTHSGRQALISRSISEEFDPGPIPIIFTAPQRRIKMYIGLSKHASAQTNVTLRAFNKQQGGIVVAQSGPILLGPSPKAVTTPIEVSAIAEIIYRVEIEYDASNFEVIDDLEFDTIGPEPRPDLRPPKVEIISPSEGQVFTLGNPQVLLNFKIFENQMLKRVHVTITGLESQTNYTVCGDGSEACSGTAPNYQFSFYTFAYFGTNTVKVIAEDFGGFIATDSKTFTISQIIPGEYDLLILTPGIFRDALTPLIDHKNMTGMPTVLLTLESIYNDIDKGRDLQEKIKLAIAKANKSWGIKYVMLVGDVDVFPVRYTRRWDSVSWGHGFDPSDLYYADLYDSEGNFDSWDKDNDSLFGEWNASPENWNDLNQDNINLYPDVAVGRIPASTVQEVRRMVNKIISYEDIPQHHRAMIITGNYPKTNEWGDHIEELMSSAGWNTVKRYWTTDWNAIPDTDPNWYSKRASLLKTEMDRGTEIVVFLGHGDHAVNPGTPGGHGGYWDGWYRYFSIANLQNSGKLPVVLASACYTAMFHYPHYPYETKSGEIYMPPIAVPNNQRDAPEPAAIQDSIYDLDTMAEYFLVKNDVGGIAYIGGYTGLQGPWMFNLVYNFINQFTYSEGKALLGDLWVHAQKHYIYTKFGSNIVDENGKIGAGYCYHHIHKMILFGDPSLRLGRF